MLQQWKNLKNEVRFFGKPILVGPPQKKFQGAHAQDAEVVVTHAQKCIAHKNKYLNYIFK